MRVRATAPGGWLAVAAPGFVLLLEAVGRDSADPVALHSALHTSDPVAATLDLVMAGGFSAMPAFALVEHRGRSAHCFVRGGIVLDFLGPEGTRSVSGTGVTSWNEQLVAGVDGFSISTGAEGGDDTRALLPLIDGAAWADRVEWGPDDATTAPTPAVPASTPAAIAVTAAPRARADAPAAEETLLPQEGTTGYDHLFGVTMMKGVEAAAVRPREDSEDEASAAAPESEPTSDIGDHDGLTMMSGDIAELRRRAAEAEPAAPAREGSRFVLELPDGRSEPLDGPVIVGRRPSATRVGGGELPRLVTLGTADADISRSHVRFTVEGGTVVITDLHSRNGTLMILPGRAPQKLREGEPTSALTGTVVDLGGGIRITVVEAPQAGL